MRTTLVLCALAACGGGGTSDDIRAICTALTECGVLPASETTFCATELDAATLDSATRAAAECADCFAMHICGEIAAGMCTTACGPFRDTVNATPGTVQITADDGNPACMKVATTNYAEPGPTGPRLHLDCDIGSPLAITVANLGVTTPVACSAALGDTSTCTFGGNIRMEVRAGLRWVTASCKCNESNATFSFDLPYRLFQ